MLIFLWFRVYINRMFIAMESYDQNQGRIRRITKDGSFFPFLRIQGIKRTCDIPEQWISMNIHESENSYQTMLRQMSAKWDIKRVRSCTRLFCARLDGPLKPMASAIDYEFIFDKFSQKAWLILNMSAKIRKARKRGSIETVCLNSKRHGETERLKFLCL